MPQPFDYNIQRPDIMGAFQAYQGGRDQREQDLTRERQKMFSGYLPGALDGDEGAMGDAMRYATPDQAIQLKSAFNAMDAKKLAQLKENQGKAAALAQWADTPDKWRVASAEVKKFMPEAPDIPFEQRGMVIAQAQSVSEQLEAAYKEKSFQLDASRTNAQNAASYASADASRANAAESRAKAAGGGGLGGIDNTTFDNMSSLRKEFTGSTKDYVSVRDAYGRIKASAENPSAAGDLSLIFNYMKVLDPGSTVREGEFATAQNAGGIESRILNLYNNAIKGERLSPAQRTDFVHRAGALFNRQHKSYLSTKGNYDGLAKRFGFDPSLVTFDQSAGMADAPQPVAQPPSFMRGGAGVFDQSQVGKPATEPLPQGWSIKRTR